MNKFNNYIETMLAENDGHTILKDTDALNEVAIQFNRNRDTKFGNVVILAGGAASGKGFVISNLLDIQGKIMDPDALKAAALKAPGLKAKVEKALKTKLTPETFKNPEMVSKLHVFLADEIKLVGRNEAALLKSIALQPPDRLPNLIFDTTLARYAKLDSLCTMVKDLGYEASKIHLVWVLTPIEVAAELNKKRSRTVSDEVQIGNHTGASSTMQQVLTTSTLRKSMDGDIFIAFNKPKADATLVTGPAGSEAGSYKKMGTGKAGSGAFLKDATYVQVKKAGHEVDQKVITDGIRDKIASYVPNGSIWKK